MRLSNKCLSLKTRVLLEKLVLSEQIKNVPALFGLRSLIPDTVRILKKCSPLSVSFRLKHFNITLPSTLSSFRSFLTLISHQILSSNRIKEYEKGETGKYEGRPAVKKLYHLHPKVFASRVSIASRVVSPRHDELRPAVSKKKYQLHRKTWVHKISKNWKVLTQFCCTLLYTQLHAHIQNC